MSDVTAAESAAENVVSTPVLNVEDIRNAVAIFDYACEHGAFKGWKTIEMVHYVRTKLQAFVDAADAATAAAEAQAADAAE